MSSVTSPFERRIQFFSGAVWWFNGSHQHSRWSGRCTLIFHHDTGKRIWSGSMSSRQALRISCPFVSHGDTLSPWGMLPAFSIKLCWRAPRAAGSSAASLNKRKHVWSYQLLEWEVWERIRMIIPSPHSRPIWFFPSGLGACFFFQYKLRAQKSARYNYSTERETHWSDFARHQKSRRVQGMARLGRPKRNWVRHMVERRK